MKYFQEIFKDTSVDLREVNQVRFTPEGVVIGMRSGQAFTLEGATRGDWQRIRALVEDAYEQHVLEQRLMAEELNRLAEGSEG